MEFFEIGARNGACFGSSVMPYRDEVDRVLTENEVIRRALAKARADARFTAVRVADGGTSWAFDGERSCR